MKKNKKILKKKPTNVMLAVVSIDRKHYLKCFIIMGSREEGFSPDLEKKALRVGKILGVPDEVIKDLIGEVFKPLLKEETLKRR